MRHTISVHVDLADGGSAHVESGNSTRYVYKLPDSSYWVCDGSDAGFDTLHEAVAEAVALAVEALPNAT
jgi:hypothetical protein